MIKFLADENVERQIVDFLRSRNADVLYMTEYRHGSPDNIVCSLAISQSRILVTNDKDFGEFVYRKGEIPEGVLLMRFITENVENKIKSLEHLFEHHSDKLKNHFTVINEYQIRIRPLSADLYATS